MSLRTVTSQSVEYDEAPAQSVAYSVGPLESAAAVSVAPAQSIAVSAAPAQSVAVSVQACQAPAEQPESRWADYSPEDVDLPFPELPEPDYKCYKAPQVPPGQTRYLNVEEGAKLKNLNQNFNDVRTAVRENNTHVQRNKTQITQVNRNHNHLLRIVTNENNFEHNLTNKIVRVQDTHRQKIENVKGETRNFKDFKQTQKVEKQGCRNDAAIAVAAPQACPAPAPPACPAPAASVRTVSVAAPSLRTVSVAASRVSAPISIPASATTLAPPTRTQVQYL